MKRKKQRMLNDVYKRKEGKHRNKQVGRRGKEKGGGKERKQENIEEDEAKVRTGQSVSNGKAKRKEGIKEV